MKVLLIFVSFVLLASCGSKKTGNSNGSRSAPTVSIATDLEGITPANAANFMLSGTCSEEGQPITVVVGEGEEDLSPETAPTCTSSETWSTEIDLTHLTGPSREVSITADHSIDNLNATQATGTALLHPRVFIDTDLEDITSTNATDFTVNGTCSEEGQAVTVSVENLNPTTAPTCTNGAWSTIVDVTSLSETARGLSITADHSTSGGLAALQATGDALVPPIVSVSTSLADITVSNADDFTVSGTCSEDGLPVTVSVENASPATAPTCTTGAWTTKVDVTGLNKIAEVSITAGQVSSDGKASAEATTSVTNEFICPDNYVGVPSLTGYTSDNFCVMKYEAKSDSGVAVSQASRKPYVNTTHAESITRCTAIGSGYDLITNDEWQTLARNIELVGDNWATGVVGNAGGLNTGHSDGAPNNDLAASSDDDESCIGTGQTCDSGTWHKQRRTHRLSNGEVIWDLAGNVMETIKDTIDDNYGTPSYVSQVTTSTHTASYSLTGGTTETSRNAKNQIGPSGNYSMLDSGSYGGLGYANFFPDFRKLIFFSDREIFFKSL